ncbi:hypothetical protein MSH00_18985, partial [Acinetobacter pittii]|nr:hypothetical protein [Acinetobacter pittii]
TCSSPQQIYGIRSTTYPSYALNLAQLGALCLSNLCATKPIKIKNHLKKSQKRLKKLHFN